MKEFDPKARCPKCGRGDAKVTWQEDDPLAIACGHLHGREHLLRTCRRCGYLWAEATKDAKRRAYFTIDVKIGPILEGLITLNKAVVRAFGPSEKQDKSDAAGAPMSSTKIVDGVVDDLQREYPGDPRFTKTHVGGGQDNGGTGSSSEGRVSDAGDRGPRPDAGQSPEGS